MSEYRKNADKEKLKIKQKEYRIKNRDKLKEKSILFRKEFLTIYSDNKEPYCKCCNEKEIKFLSLDHIYGGGTKERKLIACKGGNSFYWYLKKLGYPEDYQVLCHNCNMAKGLYGKCPHEN